MAKISLDLNKFKASGVYTVEFDSSERIVVTTQTIRLVVGFSRIGPINAPVFLRDVNTCRRTFGAIDAYLEKRGSFFHRAMEICLSVGPIFALNLMPLKSTPISEGGDTTNYRSFALASDESNGPVTRALVTSFYNKERFWFPDTEYVIATQDATPLNKDYLFTVVNLSQAPLSVIVRKSVNATQYNIPAKDYYGLGNVPDYMGENDYLSDFFLDLIIVEGDWTNLGILTQDPTFSKYFDLRGIRTDKLDAFLSLDGVTMVGTFTGCIIPDFVDNAGTNQYIENLVNAAIGLTGVFIAVNNTKIEDYLNSIHKIDTIGNKLIGTSDDVIDFLSYNTPIKNVLEYVGTTDLDPANSPDNGVTIYDGAGSGLLSSTVQIYVKSQPFGGRSGNFNNVLVIPKPEPADAVFLPSQYQFLVDNISNNTIFKTYGINTFATESPDDYVKVDNVIDTGTELQIQLSSPLHKKVGYFDNIIGTTTATLIPGTANEIEVGDFLDENGNTLVPVAPVAATNVDFILVQFPGFAKYYQVLSYAAPVITVADTGVTSIYDAAPYYFNKWGTLGLDIADFESVVQATDIKVTLFKGDLATVPAAIPDVNANSLVPNLGLVLASDDFGDSLTFAINPTTTVESFDGIGNTFVAAGVPSDNSTGEIYASVEVELYQNGSTVPFVSADVAIGAGPFYIENITYTASAAGARVAQVSFVSGLGVNTVALGAGDLGAGADTFVVKLVQSGISFTMESDATGEYVEGAGLFDLKYVEAYPGSKLNINVNQNLVVNGDSVKYNTGASEFNYLGITKRWSKGAATGSVDVYSQIAYGLSGCRVTQYTATDLVTRASTTYAILNETYVDGTAYDPSVNASENYLAFYSATGKNISSNITIIGTLSSGGKKFQVSAADSVNLTVGDLIVDNSATPRLTRITDKIKKVNPSTGVVTYEYTVLDVPAVNFITNTITKYTPIQTFCDRLQFTLLNGYVLNDYHLPNNTDAQIDKIYGVLENTNIAKTLASRDIISFRYVIDTFNGGIAPQMGPKSILSRLARDRQKCMAILNAPSIKQFIASTDPRFTELPDPAAGNPRPTLNTSYIAEGGNLSLGPSFRFSLPDEENGAKFIGVFSPNIIIREDNTNKSIPPAADVSNNFVRKFIQGLPYSIVAGPRRGVISNPKYAGLEFEYLLQDREYLEPFGINPIVTVKGIGPMIFANQTAFQTTLSAFNNLHVRDLLITVSEAIEDVLAQYLFEFNDASTRLEIRTIVENYLDTVRNAGGVYDYQVIMDETNNSAAVIDQNFGIIDVGIEPSRGLQKFINRITILKTGTISSGGFVAG